MPTESEIKKEIDLLLKEVEVLVKFVKKEKEYYEFCERYQSWYSRAVKIVELLGKDRLEEFCGYYLINSKRKTVDEASYTIQDFITGYHPFVGVWEYIEKPTLDIHKCVVTRLKTQGFILSSLKTRIDSVLSDVVGHLQADIGDEELKTAAKLLKTSIRAAGAIAGVVLEAHLQRIAKNHNVIIAKKNPTTSDLNDALKAAEIYDLPLYRQIQQFADVRNYCDHKKERDPTENEVKSLISGISALIKSVF